MNKGLAVKYRTLQGQYVDMKSKVMDMFDERNRLEAGIKDLKQLKGIFMCGILSYKLKIRIPRLYCLFGEVLIG